MSLVSRLNIWLKKAQGLAHQRKVISEDFSLLVTFLLVTFPWLFRGFFVALICLRKTVFGRFSWLFRGPRFGQILRVLALEKSSDYC